jgi:hypothetical protein
VEAAADEIVVVARDHAIPGIDERALVALDVELDARRVALLDRRPSESACDRLGVLA